MNTDKTDTSSYYDFSTSTSRRTSVPSDKKIKTSTEEQIKRIINKYLDNDLMYERDFTVSSDDITELNEIIEKINSNVRQAKTLYKQVDDCGMNKKFSEEKMIKDLVNVLQSVLKECTKSLPEKIAEIMKSIAKKSLKRCCRTIRKLEKKHINGFTEFDVVLSHLDFVHTFIKLIQSKKKTTEEASDMFNPFGTKCYNRMVCAVEESEQSDTNERILKQVMKEHITNSKIDFISVNPSVSKEEKYVKNIKDEYDTIKRMKLKVEEDMKRINDDNKQTIFQENSGSFSLTTDNIKFEKIKLKPKDRISETIDLQEEIKSIMESTTYQKIRNFALQNCKDTTQCVEFIGSRLPKMMLTTFEKNEKTITKTMKLYIKFFHFMKHTWAYVILNSFADELMNKTSVTPPPCKEFLKQFFTNPDSMKTCLDKESLNTNFSLKFSYDLFQSLCGNMLQDERLYKYGAENIVSSVENIVSSIKITSDPAKYEIASLKLKSSSKVLTSEEKEVLKALEAFSAIIKDRSALDEFMEWVQTLSNFRISVWYKSLLTKPLTQELSTLQKNYDTYQEKINQFEIRLGDDTKLVRAFNDKIKKIGKIIVQLETNDKTKKYTKELNDMKEILRKYNAVKEQHAQYVTEYRKVDEIRKVYEEISAIIKDTSTQDEYYSWEKKLKELTQMEWYKALLVLKKGATQTTLRNNHNAYEEKINQFEIRPGDDTKLVTAFNDRIKKIGEIIKQLETIDKTNKYKTEVNGMRQILKKYNEIKEEHARLVADYRKVDRAWSQRSAAFGRAENTGLLGFGFLGL